MVRSKWLEIFSGYFSFDKGEIVDKNRKRSVIKFTLYDPSCGTDRIFYLKRFYANTLRENVYSIFEWGYPKSEAKTEWDNAQILVKEGFLTIPCVAYGEHKKWGIIKQSFFISEEIPQSEPLDQLYETLNDTIRQNVPRTLGNLIKALHEKHISFPDLYTKHLFINKGDLLLEKITVSLIDLHRMRQKKRLSNTDKIRDLAALLFTLESLLSPAEIGALVHSYMSGRAITQRWNNLLAKRIERLKKRRSTERGILIRQSGDSNTAVYVNEEYYPYFEAHNLLSYNELFNYQTEKENLLIIREEQYSGSY
ncbi:MAG: hypothetical protein H7A34_05570 [bacterium]|nr:hypothetical protein [bacterium]